MISFLDLPRLGGRVYIPDIEVERVAASLIAEYGEKAAHETSARVAESKARNFDYSAIAWQRVLECVERLQNVGHDKASREAR